MKASIWIRWEVKKLNIDANLVIQKLTRQISDLTLQIAVLQTQVEILQKPQQTVEPNKSEQAVESNEDAEA